MFLKRLKNLELRINKSEGLWLIEQKTKYNILQEKILTFRRGLSMLKNFLQCPTFCISELLIFTKKSYRQNLQYQSTIVSTPGHFPTQEI